VTGVSSRAAAGERPLTSIHACPRCRGAMRDADDAVRCTSCGAEFPLAGDTGDIPCFAPPDPFYDRYALEHCPFNTVPHGLKAAVLRALPFWSYREWRFWDRAVPKCDRLLDLGAGRGKELYLQKAREVIGLDSSLAFTQACREHYPAAVLALVPPLPFADATFDVVATAHVLGHIAHDQKDELIAEIARVLKPGGVTAHIIETDSEHASIVAAKRAPELYRKWLIEQDGHIGLEPATAVIARFERHGLEPTIRRIVDAIVPSPMYYDKHLDHEGFESLPGVTWSRRLGRLNRSGTIGNAMFEVGFGAFHRTVEQWLGNPNRANFIHVAFTKR
jgi:ubiquinone/menaquinone biosynthesis C-methylase UbiE